MVFGLSGKLKVAQEINVEVKKKSDLLLELMFKQMNIQLMSSGFKNVPLCLGFSPHVRLPLKTHFVLFSSI